MANFMISVKKITGIETEILLKSLRFKLVYQIIGLTVASSYTRVTVFCLYFQPVLILREVLCPLETMRERNTLTGLCWY